MGVVIIKCPAHGNEVVDFEPLRGPVIPIYLMYGFV